MTESETVDDLAAWLTQIWDEEEQAAEACAAVYPSPWEVSDRGHTASVRADEPHFRIIAELEQEPAVDGWLGDRLQHIARHDPASVLARIAVDRQILELHVGAHNCVEIRTGTYAADWPAFIPWGKPGGEWRHPVSEYFEEDEPCQTLRLLALPYAYRPGYQEAWKPE